MNEKQTSLSGQTGTTTTVGSTGLTASQQTGAVAEAGKSIVEDAKHVASEVAGQAKQQVSTKIEGQKDKAAQGLSSVATALRQTSESLKEQDQLGVTQYFEGFADQVERLSDYVLSSNVGQLVEEAEGFARREPAIFLGGAFLLGLVGARFLKSSTPAPSYAGGEYLSENSYDYIRDENASQRGVSYGGTYAQREGRVAYGSTGGREYRGGGDAGSGTSVERERARGVSGTYGSGSTGGSVGGSYGTGSSGLGSGAGSSAGSGLGSGTGTGSGLGSGTGSSLGSGTGMGTSSGSGTSTGGTYGSGAGAGSTGGAYGAGSTGTGTGSTGSYGSGTSTGGTYGSGTSTGGTYGAGTGSTGSTSNLGGASTGSSGGYGAGTGMGTGVSTGSSTASSTASVGGGVTTAGMGTSTGTGISTGTGSGTAGVSGGGTYGAGTSGASTTSTGLETDVKSSTTLPGTGKATPDASKGTEGSGK